ncbi:ABC transporter ATP-binding protein [Azohydromonas australica]|uniref:ABC transporter ATP-binding protein n=1 Tax=Azohydromonas australica TaxID=364039 RepID=UPI000424EBE7|nr:ATP-binding cassette domain-containing protein [Azohydromonas australica]
MAQQPHSQQPQPVVEVQDLEMRFGTRLIQRGISFTVAPRTIFAVMGGSGVGKSTLLRHMIGLLPPASGRVLHQGQDYWASDPATRARLRARCGMLFQSAALWSSMTVLENVMLPLEQLTELDPAARRERAMEVLGWVGLDSSAAFLPERLSGGMKKRAGLARAIAAEPPLLFLDEPSAGLDPISARRLDDLVLDIRERTGAAVVMVSHELPSLLAIADDGIYLDDESRQPIAHGSPRALRDDAATHPTVRAFLRREEPPQRDMNP